MSERFQPGDRVRITRETWGDDIVPVGSVGTVAAVPSGFAVAFDHDPEGDGTGVWAIFDWQVEHIHNPLRRIVRRALSRALEATA